MAKSAPLFESATCSRCGGSGSYSWCQMHGSRCFKCGGRGWVLTKRGAEAARYFRALLSKPAEQLVPGDKIRVDGFNAGSYSEPTRWHEVEQVLVNQRSACGTAVNGVFTPSRLDAIRIECKGISIETFPGQLQRVAHDAPEKQAKLKQALAYQDSLTKAGQPRKVRS